MRSVCYGQEIIERPIVYVLNSVLDSEVQTRFEMMIREA